MYADYKFYSEQYHGTVGESDFPRLAVKAAAFLDYYTMGRVKSDPELDAVKMASCALVDKYSEIEQNAAQTGKKSESVGSYSVTYQTAQEIKAELADIARMYLAGTNLLYRGGCRNVCTAHGNRL